MQLEAMLAEYGSLRQESLTSITNRVTVANFTFGALAVILAALIAQKDPNLTTGLVGLFFVPQIAKTGLLIWLGEYNRSQRAGWWLKDVEKRINQTLSHRAMTWEGALISSGVHMGYPYLATALLLLGAGWASSALGMSVIFAELDKSPWESVRWWVMALLGAYVLLLEALFGRFFRDKWRGIRSHYSPAQQEVWPV